jgi:hypothetical protein
VAGARDRSGVFSVDGTGGLGDVKRVRGLGAGLGLPGHPGSVDGRAVGSYLTATGQDLERAAAACRCRGLLQRLAFLRNPAAHHQPIHRRDLNRDLASAIEPTGWICPDAAAWVAAKWA